MTRFFWQNIEGRCVAVRAGKGREGDTTRQERFLEKDACGKHKLSGEPELLRTPAKHNDKVRRLTKLTEEASDKAEGHSRSSSQLVQPFEKKWEPQRKKKLLKLRNDALLLLPKVLMISELGPCSREKGPLYFLRVGVLEHGAKVVPYQVGRAEDDVSASGKIIIGQARVIVIEPQWHSWRRSHNYCNIRLEPLGSNALSHPRHPAAQSRLSI
jgi:hypothetical protein